VARYSSLTDTTASINASDTLDFELDLPASNNVDVYKILITPSGGSGPFDFSIFKSAARASSDLIYKASGCGNPYYDPIEDDAGSYNERGEGFVCRYEDADAIQKMYCRLTNNDASARTYDVAITIDESPYNPNMVGVPDILTAKATANGLFITTSVTAAVNNATIDKAEFRAICVAVGTTPPTSEDLRTASEGGSFVHNGTTQLVITDIPATMAGATYKWTSAQAGRWFYAWRLHNAVGWSHWTDGNEDPSTVTQWVDTNSETDTGPPGDWSVTIEQGPRENTIVVHATRPRTNGFVIEGFACQIKDSSTGSWRLLDADIGAAETYYDGSAANHTFDPATGLFEKTGETWGTAAPGDLLMYDVRGDTNFDIEHCQGDVVKSVATGAIGTYTMQSGLLDTATFAGGKYTEVRIKVVKAMWNWDSEGYMGGWANNGGYWDTGFAQFQRFSFPDYTTQEFISDPIPIDPAATLVEARVWFKNGYSVSDGDIITSSGIIGGTGILGAYEWTSFTDRNWWVPLNADKDNMTITFDTSGRPVFVQTTNHEQPCYSFAGVAGRFRILPDNTGKVVVRVRFTVNQFTNDTFIWKSAVGMIMACEGQVGIGSYGGSVSDDMHGFIAVNAYKTAAPNQVLALSHASGLRSLANGIFNNLGSGPTAMSALHNTYITMPTTPFDVELKLTIDEIDLGTGPYSPAQPVGIIRGWSKYEYQIDDGGWNEISSVGSMPNILDYGASLHWGGITPFLGHFLNITATGDGATLKQFEVIKGICVRM
jgi:hypothetical protein